MNDPGSVSVIIPCNHSGEDLLIVVKAVCQQSLKPSELIIVNSFPDAILSEMELDSLCQDSGIPLKYICVGQSFPGNSRNIGLDHASGEYIAFIDVQTIPHEDWLNIAIQYLSDNENIDGVFGLTRFLAFTKFEQLVRDSFFGIHPQKTLPGSVFRKEIFVKSGRFVDWARAGEDTEWMERLNLLRLRIATLQPSSIDYTGLRDVGMKKIITKWNRNYSASHDFPHFIRQKILLWFCVYPSAVFLAFNWNAVFAGWHMDSPFYIGHITKIVFFVPLVFYVVYRGVLLPLRRGVVINSLFPIRFLAITAICFIADFVKAFVFTKLACKKYFCALLNRARF